MDEETTYGDAGTMEQQPGSWPESQETYFEKSIVDNVPVTLEARIGSTNLTIAELMELDVGWTITLDAALNQTADLCLNGETVARGEVIAVGDNFGIRITEIFS